MSVSIYPENHRDQHLNLNGRNFATLWSALGLPADWCGELQPHAILESLKTLEPALVQRRKTTEGIWSEYGIEHQQIQRYIRKLTKICDIAEKEETKVVWS